MGGPPFKDFAPYAYYVLRVEACFDIAIGMELISANDSKNFIDIMYAYYLPFCEVFVSSGTNLTFRTLTTALNFAEILECRGYHLYDFIH
jgi:hypothetical protein